MARTRKGASATTSLSNKCKYPGFSMKILKKRVSNHVCNTSCQRRMSDVNRFPHFVTSSVVLKYLFYNLCGPVPETSNFQVSHDDSTQNYYPSDPCTENLSYLGGKVFIPGLLLSTWRGPRASRNCTFLARITRHTTVSLFLLRGILLALLGLGTISCTTCELVRRSRVWGGNLFRLSRGRPCRFPRDILESR